MTVQGETASTSTVDLSAERILDNDRYFQSLVDLIPIESYGFDEEVLKKLADRKREVAETKMTKSQKRRMSTKDRRKLAANLNDIVTVTDVFAFLSSTELKNTDANSKEDASVQNNKPTKRKGKGASAKSKTAKKPRVDVPKTFEQRCENRKEALVKLHKRINELKTKRMGRDAGDYDEQKRLKRRMSKLKLKEKKKKANEKEKSDSKNPVNQSATDAATNAEATQKEIRNQEGKLVFSKFDFAISNQAKQKLMDKSEKKDFNKRDKFTGRDYKRLLTKVEARKERLEQMKERGENERAAKVEQNIKWSAALQKAEGIPVKDNPELLKKGMKRKEKQKSRMKRKWSERTNTVSKQQQDKQDKRRGNIRARREHKVEHKLKRLRKKGRNV